MYRTDTENSYGYCANGNLPLSKNKEKYISVMIPADYLSQATNMVCHNLCQKKLCLKEPAAS